MNAPIASSRRARLLALALAGIALGAGATHAQSVKTPPGAAAPASPMAPAITHAADIAEATTRPPIDPGNPVQIRLQRGKSAFFRLPEGAGDLVAQTRRLARGTDTVMALLDAQGRVLEEDDDGGTEGLASLIEVAASQGGPLFLRVGLLENNDGAFELIVERQPPADPSGPPASLTDAVRGPELAIGATIPIRLLGRQEAWFRLPANGRDMVVLTRNLQDGADTVLSLHDRNGRVVAEDDDGGDSNLASRLEVPGARRRPLYLRARMLGPGGSFELVAQPDTAPAAPMFPTSQRAAAAAPPLALGQAVPITLRRGQAAFFRLPDGDIAVFTRNLRRNADTVLTLIGADGRTISEDDDGGGGLASRIEVPAREGRPLFIRATLLGDSTGEFELVAEADAPPATNIPLSREAAATAQPLAPGAVVPIRLRRGEAAFFRLAPGAAVAVTRNLMGDTDTVLQLIDGSGGVIAEDDDGGGGLASRLALDAGGGGKGGVLLRAGILGDGAGRFELAILPAGR